MSRNKPGGSGSLRPVPAGPAAWPALALDRRSAIALLPDLPQWFFEQQMWPERPAPYPAIPDTIPNLRRSTAPGRSRRTP